MSTQIRAIRRCEEGLTYFCDGDVLFAKITAVHGERQDGRCAVAAQRHRLSAQSSSTSCGRATAFDAQVPRTTSFRAAAYRREAAHHMTGAVGQKRVPSRSCSRARSRCAPLARAAPHRRRDRKAVLPPRRSRRQPPARQGQPQALQGCDLGEAVGGALARSRSRVMRGGRVAVRESADVQLGQTSERRVADAAVAAAAVPACGQRHRTSDFDLGRRGDHGLRRSTSRTLRGSCAGRRARRRGHGSPEQLGQSAILRGTRCRLRASRSTLHPRSRAGRMARCRRVALRLVSRAHARSGADSQAGSGVDTTNIGTG